MTSKQHRNMNFTFAIGKAAAHEPEFTLDRVSGDLKILLDGTKLVEDSQKPSADLDVIKRYALHVGEAEKHKVAVRLRLTGNRTLRVRTPPPL